MQRTKEGGDGSKKMDIYLLKERKKERKKKLTALLFMQMKL